jgi:hypothetical protein
MDRTAWVRGANPSLVGAVVRALALRKEILTKVLAVGIGLGCLLRMAVCLQHNPVDYLFSDPLRHWLNGERLFDPGCMGASDPIVYQVYLWVLRSITCDERLPLALGCGLLSVVTPWLYYRAGRELGLDRVPALCAWLLITWTPSLFTIHHYFMMETLLLPLVGLALWVTARTLRKKAPGTWLAVVACWMLAIMTKVTVIPLAGICLAWVWFRSEQRVRYLIFAGLLAAVMLAPNAWRTREALGFAAPLGNGWLTKIQHRSGTREIKIQFGDEEMGFASPSVAIQPLAPLSPWAIRRAWEETRVSVVIDPARGENDWREAYARLKVPGTEWARQLGENIVLFLFGPSWPDGNRFEWDGWLSHHLRWMWAPLMFVVLECNLRNFFNKRFELLPVATTAFLLCLMFQNVATAEGRYRKPLEPLLLLNFVWAMSPRRLPHRHS